MEQMRDYDYYIEDMEILVKIVSALEFLYKKDKGRAVELFYEIINEHQWKDPLKDILDQKVITLGDLIYIKNNTTNSPINFDYIGSDSEHISDIKNNLTSTTFLIKNAKTGDVTKYESYNECMEYFSTIDDIDGVSIYKQIDNGREIKIF